jgi:hypothetical protein
MATWNSWDEAEPYCWAVVCKNHRFHNRENIYKHLQQGAFRDQRGSARFRFFQFSGT